jgi:hypothetical protein
MPLSRTSRQRRTGIATATREPRPKQHNGIDAFGTLRAGEIEVRARLIEYEANKFAAFRTDGEPITFQAESYTVKGRLLTAQVAEGPEIRFQKAGCGCETPHQLRGARAPLLAQLEIAEPPP